MPLYRRVARRGFTNAPFKVSYVPLSLSVLDSAFAEGEVVTLDSLKAKGIVKGKDVQVKVLANGELTHALTIEGLKLSASAKEAVEKAGGSVK